jgi:putative hydrolase of the HAD superfamily
LNRKYDAVIFDLFGTLIDDLTYPESQMKEYRRVSSEMASALGVPAEQFHRVWAETGDSRMAGGYSDLGASLEAICRELGESPNARQIAEATRLRIEYIRSAMAPRPDTIDTLARLRQSDYKVGLISDCGPGTAAVWDETSFAPLIDEAILSCSVGMKKPDPRIYQLACERLQVSPDRCLYVGDGGSNELTGATEMGMRAVLIRAPYDDSVGGYREEWLGQRISTLGEVLPLLNGE